MIRPTGMAILPQGDVRRDHFVYTHSQWETTLQCNVVSHWLCAYTKWSLCVQANNTDGVAWIGNYHHDFLWDVISHPCLTPMAVVMAGMSNNIWFNSSQVMYRDKHRWRGFYEERIPWQPFLYYYLYGHHGTAGLRIRKNIYRSDIQVTFEFDGHFHYRSSIPNKTTFTKYCLIHMVPTPLGRPKIRTFPGPFQDLRQIYKDLQLTYDS